MSKEVNFKKAKTNKAKPNKVIENQSQYNFFFKAIRERQKAKEINANSR